jgi:hypothetical protein
LGKSIDPQPFLCSPYGKIQSKLPISAVRTIRGRGLSAA